ncbi:MAG: tripartite tricarboxylate transporter substrate binding protein [Betaproteobacteria bacterium]|jgi:tripartite-type tricarboxylate transporter receptor subunit TctC
MKNRRKVLSFLGATSLLPLVGEARADNYPSKSIRLIVPYPPGGGSDTFARVIAPKLSNALGQQFIVDNRPGAATIVGAEFVAKAPADGYTLLLGDNSTYAVNSSLYKKLPYSPMVDFAPISLTAKFSLLLVVNPSMPANKLSEFVAYAKSRPKQINFASPGAGSPHHLAMELFADRAGIQMTHVPYKGGAPAAQDLLAGVIPAMVLDYATAAQHIQSGKLRAIAALSDKRLDQLKELPTIAESGYPGFEAWAWQGIVVPAKTPEDIVQRLNAEIVKVALDKDVQAKISEIGGEFKSSTPSAMMSYMRSETDKWAKIIKEANISID